MIYKWSSGDPRSVFLEKSGYTGKDVRNVGDQTMSGRLAILPIGSNELPHNGFYLIKDGKVTLPGSDKDHPDDFPNGIAL